MLKQTSLFTVLLLAAVTALGPLATDLYLPALPAIGHAFGAGPDQVQLTLSLYIAAFALAQLLCGPLSDRFGRKPVLLAGMSIFTLASLLCAFAPTIELLYLGRALQALGGATGPVLGRAAVRDIYGPQEAGRILSYMASTMAIAPAAAPIVGGLLLVYYGWESTFLALALYGALMVMVIALLLREPLPDEHRQSIRPGAILANFRMLLSRRIYVGYTLTNAAAFSGLFAFLSGSSFVLIEFLGVPPTHYGMYFAIGVGGFLCGTLLGGRLSRSLGTDRLVLLGGGLCCIGGGTMAVLALAGVYDVLAVILPQTAFQIGIGLLMPQTLAGAIAPFPQCAGSASSLFGFIQMAFAAGSGTLVGRLHDGTARTMAIAIALAGLLALLSYIALVRPARRAAAAEARTAPSSS